MGRCSYNWKEWNYEKGRDVEKRCIEETWKSSNEFCIFHDPSPEKDVDLFKKKLEEQMQSETEKHNFIGYYFPENWDFSGKEFKVDADFRGASFQNADFRKTIFKGNVYFGEATFKKDANFNGVAFQGIVDSKKATFRHAFFREAIFQESRFLGATFKNADFGKVIFKKDADFSRTTFQEDANFINTTFQDVFFFRATFKTGLEFIPKKFKILDLRYTQFFFKGHITADLTYVKFHRSKLENVAFIDCYWPKRIYEEVFMKDKDINLSFNELETIYRDLKQNMQRHGNHHMAGELYYREMEMRRKGAKTMEKRLWLEVFRFIAGYGEKPKRTAISSFITIMLFALFYWISGCLQYTVQNPCPYQQIKDSIYFSFVTFTTLGLGDIRPLNDLGKFLICCEAVIGAFLIALFVVVFARKMMR